LFFRLQQVIFDFISANKMFQLKIHFFFTNVINKNIKVTTKSRQLLNTFYMNKTHNPF